MEKRASTDRRQAERRQQGRRLRVLYVTLDGRNDQRRAADRRQSHRRKD